MRVQARGLEAADLRDEKATQVNDVKRLSCVMLAWLMRAKRMGHALVGSCACHALLALYLAILALYCGAEKQKAPLSILLWGPRRAVVIRIGTL
jgi:hypothetical protein